MRWVRTAAGVLVTVLLTRTPVSAQDFSSNLAAMEDRLTAGAWVLGTVDIYPGGHDCIAGGERYIFSRFHAGEHSRCVHGSWSGEPVQWSLKSAPPTDVELLIGNMPYLLYFAAEGNKTYMVLRTRKPGGKLAGTTDRTYHLSE